MAGRCAPRVGAALAGLLAASLWLAAQPAAGSAADERERVEAEIARAVVAQVPGAELRSAQPVEDREGEESLMATPPLSDLLLGRLELTLDPDYWTQVVANLLVSQTVVLPKPVDLVKVEALLPTARVAPGNRPWRLQRRERPLGEVEYEWQGRQKTVDEFVRTSESDGVAFMRNGRIVADIYANGWSADIRHQPWSVTKSFVSALVGIALEEGKVRALRDPIELYVPDLRGTAWEGTTIRNLLAMESGVHWDENTPVLAVNTQVEQWVQMALDLFTDGALGQTRNEFLMSLPRVAPQGTEFSYNSGNTQVLAWLLENVYREPFNEVISRKLWRPMGMATDAMVMTDRVGDAVASQGLYSRINDLARFGELFRRGGRTPAGRQVVPASWVRRSTTMTPNSEGSYAFQWWSGATPLGYEASGFQGQKITVGPESCLVGVRLSHTLGGNLTPGGDDPLDPGAWGFDVEMGSGEWAAAFAAVSDHVGACDRALRLRVARSRPIKRARVQRLRAVPVRVSTGRQLAEVQVVANARVRRAGRPPRALRIAAGRATLAPGSPQRVLVRLNKRGRTLLRRGRALNLNAVARATDDAGSSQRAKRRVAIRR